MRARVVGRAGRVDDREMTLVVNALERRERRVKSVKAVQVNDAIIAGRRFFDGDARPQSVISAVFERDDRVQPVHGAALKDDHHGFAFADLLRFRRAHEKSGWQPEGEKS